MIGRLYWIGLDWIDWGECGSGEESENDAKTIF